MNRALGLTLGLALLAGCGGGGGGTSTPVTVPAATLQTADVSVVINVPRGTTSSTSRTAQYVSSGTASVKVTVGALNASAPCVSPATTCTVSIAAPLGSDSFTVTLLDGSSNLLATGTTVATVVANVLNTIPLTFNGVVNSLNLSFSTPSITLGAPASSTLTIVAKDAAGFTILQPGNYTNSIVVTESPALPAAISLSGATTIGAIPASNSTIVANYDGTAVGTSYAFTATSGSITGTATLSFPAAGSISLSPATVQFTGLFGNPPVAISEANYAGTFSISAPGCAGIAVASPATLSAGNTFLSALGVGTCTMTVSDTIGNSNTFTVNVATTTLTGS